ncbi:MAG: SDR family oxidoreductase [Alphaproteobacteria bacterium]
MNHEKTAAHFDMTGKVCVITGGSRGLGKQMAHAFADAGASVIVSSRKQAGCDAAAGEIAAATGQKIVAHACHVADWDQCDSLLNRAYDEFGKVDVLVNNAGMSPLYPKLSDVSRELWDKVIGVNLAGPFRLSAVAAERMAAGDGGSIINVSSIAAIAPSAAEIPYGAAKAGLNNLTEAIAHAYGPKVRANCIMPGPFLTDIADAWTDEVKDAMFSRIPLKRGGAPEEIIGIALYLASDASAYTTGSLIKVDGGAAYRS